MLIGIDASRSAAAFRTGTESYSLNLIREMVAIGPDHVFRLYFNQAPREGLIPGAAELRLIPFPRLWTHLRLSWEMIMQPPDLLFVPAHVLPLVRPERSVVTVHDLGFLHHPEAHTWFQNVYLRWSTRHNARSATRILADSQATRQDLIRYYGIPKEKTVVVYPGLDRDLGPVTDADLLAATRDHYGISERYLFYVGTLHPRKNLARLVRAFAGSVAVKYPELQLVLAGKKGWLSDGIVEEVRSAGLVDQIVLTGYVPDSDLPALMSGALAFVFPSLYEGFGMPVLEAMACGTPVVCSNVSSLPEVAGEAALLVDPLDTGALAQALIRIAEDADLRCELVLRGLERVRAFSWRRCAQETLQVLEEVGRGVD